MKGTSGAETIVASARGAAVVVVCMALAWTGPASGASAVVRDPGFEVGTLHNQNGAGIDWVGWGSAGIETPTDAQFPGASSGALPGPAGGVKAAVGGWTFGGRIWQLVDGITVQANMVYTLTVACGRALDDPWDATEWDIYLSAGVDANATRLGTKWITPDSVARGTFVDQTLVVDTTGLDPSLVGQGLVIALHDTGHHPDNFRYYFDNVRLDASTVGPQPHLTASPPAGSTIDMGHVNTSRPTTTSTITLSNTGETGSTIAVTAGTLPQGSLFAFSPEFNPATLTVGGTDFVSYGVKFLGSDTPGTYTDTLTFTTNVGGTVSYTLSATVDVTGPHMGDINSDRKVDLQDFSLLKFYYSQSGSGIGWAQGDLNNDHKVDLQDFSFLKGHYNHTGDASTVPVTAVPEPALAALLPGLLALIRRRR